MKDGAMILWWKLGLSIIAVLGNTYLADGSRSSCQATPVVKGDRATITCYFGDEVSAADSRISIDKYNATNHLETVLECYPVYAHLSHCTVKGSGYTFNGTITNPLVLVIPVANEQHAGTYVCHLLPSDRHDMEPCTLTVTDPVTTPPMDVTPKTTKEFETTEIDGVTVSGTTAKEKNTTHGATTGAGHEVMSPVFAAGVVVSVAVILLLVTLILLFLRYPPLNTWIKDKLWCTAIKTKEEICHSGTNDAEVMEMVQNGDLLRDKGRNDVGDDPEA